VTNDYFRDRSFYQIQAGTLVDNPDQRISSDIRCANMFLHCDAMARVLHLPCCQWHQLPDRVPRVAADTQRAAQYRLTLTRAL